MPRLPVTVLLLAALATSVGTGGIAAAAPPSPAIDGDAIEVLDMLAPGGRRTVRPDWSRINAQPLGSKQNPVRADFLAGQQDYLGRLLCRDGTAPSFRRRGSLPEHGPYDTVIDIYDVQCGDQVAVIHMDMYHPGYAEMRPVPGFSLRPQRRHDTAPAVAGPPLKALLDRLSRTATPQQVGQIAGAIEASPRLARQLLSLLEQRQLSEIRVARQRSGKPFDGWIEGTAIVFTTDFLQSLASRGAAVPAPASGDLAPNDTVYALAHLAHHLAERAPDPGKYARVEDFVTRALEIEAGACIAGFNAVMDAGLKANGGRPPGERQVRSFLVNAWYGEALQGTQIGADGMIAPTRANIDAVRGSLRKLTRLE